MYDGDEGGLDGGGERGAFGFGGFDDGFAVEFAGGVRPAAMFTTTCPDAKAGRPPAEARLPFPPSAAIIAPS